MEYRTTCPRCGANLRCDALVRHSDMSWTPNGYDMTSARGTEALELEVYCEHHETCGFMTTDPDKDLAIEGTEDA